MAKKYIPSVSKRDFDQLASRLQGSLKRKYNAAKKQRARRKPNPVTKGAFGHLPDLDSKTVAKWSSVVKRLLGCKLDPNLIRKGGYTSFNDFWQDLAPKLRASCPDATPLAISTGRVSP